jgi:hypothetical protein
MSMVIYNFFLKTYEYMACIFKKYLGMFLSLIFSNVN